MQAGWGERRLDDEPGIGQFERHAEVSGSLILASTRAPQLKKNQAWI